MFRLAIAWTGLPLSQLTVTGSAEYAALVEELRRLGYVEGRNLTLQRWGTAGIPETKFDELAREVVSGRPDAIFCAGSRLVLAMKAATTTIPIVFYAASPLDWRLVQSLARPEANATGIASDTGTEFSGKRLQLLRDAKPAISTVAYLATAQLWAAETGAQVRAAAEQLGLKIVPLLFEGPVTAAAIGGALATIPKSDDVGLLIPSGREFQPHARAIADIALAAGWPAGAIQKDYPVAGLLMSYGADAPALLRKAAGYIDRILKGAKPGDLPVQQPTDFDFVVNLKTAKALGLTLPEHLMVFATEIIE